LGTETPTSPEKKSHFWLVPLVIAFLFVGHIAAWLAFVFLALDDRTAQVEPDYYRKSMAWNETSAKQRASRALGWMARVEIDAHAGPGQTRRLALSLVDSKGVAVDGAHVGVEIFAHVRSDERQRLELAMDGDGVYSARPVMPHEGTWEVRVEALRGPLVFVDRVLVDVGEK